MPKKLYFAAAIAYTTALAYASLMNLKDMPQVNVPSADKIFHCIAYAILSLLWFLVLKHKYKKAKKIALVQAIVAAVIFGIIIEVLQGTLTTYRAFDVYDAVANTLGALFTSVLIVIKNKLAAKNR